MLSKSYKKKVAHFFEFFRECFYIMHVKLKIQKYLTNKRVE